MEDSVPRMVEVFRAGNVLQAHAVKVALDSAGIPAQVDGELLTSLAGVMPMGWESSPRVLVSETHAIEARELIERLDDLEIAHRSHSDDGEDVVRCLACGKVMAEDDDACPACGWSYEEEA